MVLDSREQVISKGARIFDRKWSKWRGWHPAATNLNSQFDREISSARLFGIIHIKDFNFALLPVARHKLAAHHNNKTTEPSP
ncbi:hypothetical protein KIN20_020200 [Parelaphostrongylus tenuis]|uniref:Uncharacterized protein n=1 Tax=Parelaphostrongylus tenuis TaxID=148309 RepID=A0AAD5QTE1_PARTN|nr:hypothetical protein KIN20_020200 [Parelaphostrongylus tenuis]